MVGGMKAVIWTDFMQFFVMMGRLFLLIAILLASFDWNPAAAWDKASTLTAPDSKTPYTTLVDWRFDFKTAGTVWSLVFFYLIYTLGTYGTDQVVVQRFYNEQIPRHGDIRDGVIRLKLTRHIFAGHARSAAGRTLPYSCKPGGGHLQAR